METIIGEQRARGTHRGGDGNREQQIEGAVRGQALDMASPAIMVHLRRDTYYTAASEFESIIGERVVLVASKF